MAKTKDSFGVHYWAQRYEAKLGKSGIPTDEGHSLYRIFKENCPSTEKRVLRPMLGKPY